MWTRPGFKSQKVGSRVFGAFILGTKVLWAGDKVVLSLLSATWPLTRVVGAFFLQVSPQEMVQEIHQVLMDREDTCHRTCFSLHLDGNVLDHFSELRSVEGLQEGSVLRVVEGWSGSWALAQGRVHGGRGRQHRPCQGPCVTDELMEAGLEHRSASQAITPISANFTAHGLKNRAVAGRGGSRL